MNRRAPRVLRSAASPASLALSLLACGAPPVSPGQPPADAPAPTHASAEDPALAVALPLVPDFTDRYADGTELEPRFFEIEQVMARYELSRLQAIELQNLYRDLGRAAPERPSAERFDEALRRVRAGELESGLDAAALAAAPFIVVFDLDETLYDQRAPADPACHDLVVDTPGGRRRHIRRAPDWAEAFGRVRALGGLVVLFSANLDEVTHENLRAWTLDGAPLLRHPDIAGVLTNSHLVRQHRREGPGRESPRRGHPVAEPSKDLRMLDPTLERVIIIDDNPQRLFQWGNTRWIQKLRAQPLCDSATPAPARAALERQLTVVVDEIEESLGYQRAHPGVTFAQAYAPYTVMGRIAVGHLRPELDEAAAIELLRRHPHLIDQRP